MRTTDEPSKKRVPTLRLAFLAAFFCLAAHLFYIQIVDGEKYALRATQQGTETVILEEVSRGEILDRNMIPLTGGGLCDFVIIFPRAIKDKEEVATGLAKITALEKGIIEGYLERGAGYIPYPLTPTQVKEVNGRAWQGVMVQSVNLRYGKTPLANHVLGYLGYPSEGADRPVVGITGTDLVGVHGLEKYYQDRLAGTRPVGAVSAFFDATDNLIYGPGFALKNAEPDPGRKNLVLTIDSHIQGVVERIMDEQVPSGAVVVMDVCTGDILAMASRPDFDPKPGAAKPTGSDGVLLDQCTSYYQPGSVFKMVIAAAALEEGIVRPGTSFFCEGDRDDLIPCWYKEGHGAIDFADAFASSCNPVFARVGLELGAERVIDYAKKFGFGESDIVGYPAQGLTPDLATIGEGFNLVNSAVGQWPVLATPVQVTAALNTLLNDGVYIEPRLVRELRYPGGGVAEHFSMGKSRKVVSMSTAWQMRKMMEMVTTDGVGKEAYVEAFGSAGKTGSAQIEGAVPRIDAWFTGYAPTDKPKFAVTVLVKDGVSGGVTAAPVFRQIMENIL